MITTRDTFGCIDEAFGSDATRASLQTAGLASFEALWTLDAPWVEEPNRERRGWSGVCRIELPGPGDNAFTVYLKRQENHGYRSLTNPFRYRPTAYREYKCLVAMKAAALAVPEVMYYGERRPNGAIQAILATKGIPRAISLDAYLSAAQERPAAEVAQTIFDTASLIAHLHHHRFQHCALYGKHILLRGFQAAGSTVAQVKPRLRPYLIDVEKARRRPLRLAIALRDLNQLYRRAPWSSDQWEAFLAHYSTASRMPGSGKLLGWLIQRRVRSKQTRRTG